MESSTANFNQDRNSVIEIFFAVGSMGGILSKNSEINICDGVSFNQIVRLQPASYLKNWL